MNISNYAMNISNHIMNISDIPNNNSSIYNINYDIYSNIYSNIYINSPGGYAIFNTVEECDLFIEYIHSLNRNILIGKRCSLNKGCYIINIYKINIEILKNEFLESRREATIGYCDICFETKQLVHRYDCSTRNECEGHPFCADCLDRTTNCPLCRNPNLLQ